MVKADAEDTTQSPDWGWSLSPRMPDGGPRYTETPRTLPATDDRLLAEPWNAATALLFVGIVIAWLWRLRGRYRQFPFLCCCMPVLLVGGIGGALYHGLRSSRYFLMMDVIPISVLGLAGAVYLAVRLSRKWAWLFICGALMLYGGVNMLLFRFLAPTNRQEAISLSYVSLAVLVLTPIVLTLLKSRFRHAGWIAAGVVSFTIAWGFRVLDARIGDILPMGSHWLWHAFGALSTALVIEFFYRVEGEPRFTHELIHDRDESSTTPDTTTT